MMQDIMYHKVQTVGGLSYYVFENALVLKISEFNGDDGKGKTGEEK